MKQTQCARTPQPQLKRELVIFRGLPGTGKTTLAGLLCGVVFAADDYFVQPDGSFRYDSSQIEAAHAACRRNVEEAMQSGIEVIGVANTHTRLREFERYFSIAEKHGYRVHVVVVENYHGGTSEHGVPDAAMVRMSDRFELKLM